VIVKKGVRLQAQKSPRVVQKSSRTIR
jgi:hypothetical protein